MCYSMLEIDLCDAEIRHRDPNKSSLMTVPQSRSGNRTFKTDNMLAKAVQEIAEKKTKDCCTACLKGGT